MPIEMEKVKPKHFLIVENNRDDAFLIRRALELVPEFGSASICRNGSEARAYLKGAGMYADRSRYPMPNAIVSDLLMDGETGLQLLHWIRGQETLQAIPLVILTGSASPSEIETARYLGAERIYQKPPKLEELQNLLLRISVELENETGKASIL